MTPPYADAEATRRAVVDACLWMGARGLNQGTSGNVSVRAGTAMLITPSAIPYDAMDPETVARVPLAGGAAEGPCKPSSEWHFHRALYRARPGIHAVVHAHPAHATALSMLRAPIPACHYMVAAFGGHDIPVAGYALFGTEALSSHVVAALQDRQGCLMANHGATTTGETLERALWRMEELEVLARGFILARQAGTPHLLSREEIDATLAKFEDYGPRRDR